MTMGTGPCGITQAQSPRLGKAGVKEQHSPHTHLVQTASYPTPN